MPEDFQPILLVATQHPEYRRKHGGGATKPPIVPVTSEYRANLQTQVSTSAKRLEGLPTEQKDVGVPLAIRLREQAFAKSNRPYALLESVGSAPVAAGRVGELIARATPESLTHWHEAIEGGTSKANIYELSTLESLSLWDPILDAFGVENIDAANQLLDQARAVGRPLRVDLFPWINIDTPVGPHENVGQRFEANGFHVVGLLKHASWTSIYLDVSSSARADTLSDLFGIRTAAIALAYAPYEGGISAQNLQLRGDLDLSDLPTAVGNEPLVGLLDSGVLSSLLVPWIADSEQYDTGADLDTWHGTFVAGLMIASRGLNDDSDLFPDDSVRVVDAQVLPKTTISELMLIERITEVVEKYAPTGPRVWNCSFSAQSELRPICYSQLGQEMDRLSEQHGVLFVQAAGNYCEAPTRTWPPNQPLRDGLASPADAVASLTVGALSHLGGLTPVGCPASYSRRGPSFGGQHKPDVTHWSGDLDQNETLNGYGVLSVGPGDKKAESIGTSFSTPIVSSIAANVWAELEDSGSFSEVRPELVKGLIVHSASVDGLPITDAHRAYHGVGVPSGGLRALFNDESTFTTVHEVDLRAGIDWRKDPFPVPECLLDGGKLRAELFMTLVYSPLIDPAFGDEAVRTSVEASLGVLVDNNGRTTLQGKVPLESGTGIGAWEAERITQGKWSPVKTYHKKYPIGTKCDGDWALKLSMTVRDPSLDQVEQKVFVLVTFRSVRDGLPVYQDGLRALNSLRYQTSALSNVAHLRVGAQ